jgi:hypothetical protein
MKRNRDGTFSKVPYHEYVCSTWFERDRSNITLTTPGGREIFALWDDDVYQAIELGLLPTPHHPRPTDEQWLPCAIKYAQSQGLLP